MSDIFGLAATRLKSELQQGAEVTPPNANDLEAAARRMRQENDAARLRQTAIEAQGSNPDTAARAQRLGRDMGLPPAVVERNLPEVERQAELSRLDGLAYDEYMANYFANADNYRIARDDVSTLEDIGKAARVLGNVARAVPGGAVGGAGSAISGLGSGYDALTRNYVGRPIDAVMSALGLGSLQDYSTELPWWVVPTEILRRGGGAIKSIGRAIDPPQDEQNIATDIAGGVGQLGMQIATVILTGGAATLPMLLAQGADQQAERLERQGKYGTAEGDAAIVAGAAVTALTEKYGLDFIMRKLPQAARDGIMRRLQDVAVSAGAEALQEVVEGILQNVVEYAYYNPDAEILQDFSREAIAAGGAAAVVRSVLLAASGGRASAQRRQDSERAQQDSEALKRVNELAEQSKLRERNPDKFREFVRGLVEPERAVEIDAETAVELFQSEPDLTQFMTRDEAERVGREVALAREVGSDVRMPLSTFIGAFVGHPQFDTLAENVRLSDNAPTAREASMTPEDLERQVGLLREEVGTVARQQEVTRQIYDDIFAQLKAAAVDDLSATKYAAIFTARLRTRAERLGQDPLELYRQSRPEIRRKYDGPRLRLARLGTPAEPEYVSPVMPAGLKRTLEDARKGVKLRQRSMTDFLVSLGGVRDDGGELLAIMGTYRARVGLVNNKPRKQTPDGRGWTGGLALDMAHEAAIEEGYMSADSTLSDFLEVLADDVNNRVKNYGLFEDFEGQERQRAAQELERELDALGLTVRDSDEVIAKALGIEPEMASATLEDLEALDRMRFRGAEPAPLGPAEDPNARTLDQGALPDPRETLRQYQGGTSVTQKGFLDLSDQADDLLDAVRDAQSIKAAEKVADDWVVARGKKTGLEHLVAFDRDGGMIAVGRGSEGFIAFPKTMIDAGKAGRIAYATHNHPRNSGFSVPDLGGSLEYGMDITAMGHGGAIVSGRAGPALAGKDLPVGLAGNIMAEIEKPVRDYFQEKVNAGQISVDRALFAHSHVVDIFRHRYGLIDLRSNGLQFINGAGFDINTIIRTIDEKVANVLQRNKLDIPAVRDFTGDQAPGGSFRAEQGGAGAVGVSQGGGGAARRPGRIVPGSDPRQLALLESDTLEVDGVLRPTANSEGRPIHPTEEGVRNFWRWFGDSKVVDDQGRPLVVYHGTGNAEELIAFDPSFTGKGNDQLGSGFYFTNNPDEASSYTTAVTQGAALSGQRKLGGDASPGVLPVALSIRNPIVVSGSNLNDADINITQKQAFDILKRAPNIRDIDESPIGNWFDVWGAGKITDKMIREVASNYLGATLISLENDFFRNESTVFREALRDVLGYDGVVQDFGDGKKHFVAWFPTQIKSAIANTGAFSRDDGRILNQEDPRNLVVLHNLKPEAVLYANKMGGLPIPSVAVANKDQGFGGFGSISLVGSPSLVDPKQDKAAKVFDADVYSPRYPTVTYEIDFKALRAVKGDLKALAERLGRDFYDGDLEEKGGRAIREGVVWKAKFLEERGALPDPVLGTDGKVDRWKTEEAIEAAVKPLDAEFSDWADAQEKKLIKKKKIFDGFTPMGSRRYLPHNLDVVVRLLKKELRGGESFNYGVGSIRAHHAKQFKSLKEIQAKRGNLVSSEAMEAVKKELNDDFTKLADSLKNNYKFSVGFKYYDDFSAALGEMVKRGRAPLNEAFNDLSQEQLADINAFITKLRNAPAEYFGAKIQRVVKLNEFVGAIVPRYGVSDKVIAALEANGLKIVRYDTAQERTAALGEFQNEFFQRQETGPRGSIQFLPDGQTIINLTEKADLSTFLHEMSHAWLEEMKADARLPDAPAQIVEDWNRIAAYLGIDPNVDFIPTEAHETFARTGEAYFMEGKAPSLELASAFERFKAWMVRIYRTIAGLNVPINDEIRGVFDRMLAADDEIEAAKNQFKFEGLFALAKDAGMTEDEFRRYQDLAAKARLEAEQKVLAMLQAEERRAQREEYREARETITAEVEAQVKGEPVYQTIAMLARGEMPDGTTLDTPMKLDRAMVRASYGTGIGKRLPRGVMADNGVPPDLVAPMFGFTSGDEMIKAMEAAPPLQQEIRRRVQERLKEQFPNPVDDGRAAEEAIEALHNDAQMQVLEAEFKALQRLGAGKLVDAAVRRSGGQGQQAGQAMGPEARAEAALGAQRRAAEGKAARERVKVTVDSLRADRKAIERAADAVINDTTVNDLLNTQKWRRAERASANAVIDAVAGQDWPAAAWHQRQRIINAHMVRRSMEARKDIEKAIGRFDKYLSRKPGPIDPDYLEKVRTILSAYQFGPQLSDRRRNLLELRAIIEWQKALSEDEQARLDIPPEITAADEKTHYRDMTVGEFMALRDTVENLATVGRTKNRLLREQAERDLNRTAKMVAETILDNVKIVARRSREAVEKGAGYGIAKFKDQFFASHRKIESLVREFDGFQKLGPVWQALFKPLQDAQNTETRMSIEATEAIRKLFEGYPADARRTWRTKTTYYPEIGQSLSKATVMSIALNWGNEGNREAIRKGYKWSDDQVRAVLNQTLTESDWQFVQGVWDYIDSFWPKLAALEKRVKGIEPVKVEASPVRTPFGELRGGYYPLKYDPDLSERAFSFQVDKMAQNLMTGQVAKASTRTGAALERVGSGGMPVRLELDVMFEHVAEVIHDLSHREAVLDVMRLLEHPEVKGAVLETKGPQFHRAMKDWVRDIAAGDVPALTWFDKVVQHLRGGMSIAAMGWKLTTALVQVTGFGQSAVMLPKGALLKSVAGFYGNPLAMSRKADFVFERSVEMRTRSKNLDRDIRDSLRKLGPEGKADALKRSFFYLTGLIDMGVALPTWLAAYETGMDQFQGDEAKAIDYADQVVRTTQSSGLQKDLASIQRGDPRMKMFTAFYSYFSATYNLMVEQGRGMKGARDMPRFVANMALLTIVPAVLSELLLGRGPDEDEEGVWWAWAGKVGLKFALSGFVGVRDVVNALGSDFGYAGSPVGSAVESMVRLGKQIGQGEADRGLARAAFDAAGPVLHLPSRQAWITAEGIYLWSEGREITPFEIFVTRDPKKFK